MESKPVDERIVLVTCVGCGRLHQPEHPLALHPLCRACGAERTAPSSD